MRLTFKPTPQVPEYRGWHDGEFIHVLPGQTVEVKDAASAETLIKDYPANFAAAEPEARGLESPPADKMIRKAPVKKTK